MILWDRVTELRDEVGAEDFGEVVEIFLEEVDDVIARLRRGPDPSRMADDMHFLRGSALNLGFDAFGKLCEQAERAAAGGAPAGVDLAAITSCYEESKGVFLAWVEGRDEAA